jgi:hypothetical protein
MSPLSSLVELVGFCLGFTYTLLYQLLFYIFDDDALAFIRIRTKMIKFSKKKVKIEVKVTSTS